MRSSATAEDSADASFAGQQDTYLWIVGEDAVLEHVRRCWASLYSPRSISYRRSRGIDRRGLLMGVVVQRMVDADAAGVAMTLIPSNGDRSMVAIESSYGLGETVVGGTVTPDSLPGRQGDARDRRDARSRTSRSSWWPISPPAAPSSARWTRSAGSSRRSTRDQVKAVAALAKRAEQHYGCPQDVEWALDGDSVLLLQSRPETLWSRKPPPARRRHLLSGASPESSTR